MEKEYAGRIKVKKCDGKIYQDVVTLFGIAVFKMCFYLLFFAVLLNVVCCALRH